MHVAAHLGPAHATLDFGGDAIVFFDPFWFDVDVYAEVGVGITIWLLFGTVDIDLSLGFDVEVAGPPIFVDGSLLRLRRRDPVRVRRPGDPADRALIGRRRSPRSTCAATPTRRSCRSRSCQGRSDRGQVDRARTRAGVDKPPDGSIDHPFRVVPEFQLTFVTTAPTEKLSFSQPGRHRMRSRSRHPGSASRRCTPRPSTSDADRRRHLGHRNVRSRRRAPDGAVGVGVPQGRLGAGAQPASADRARRARRSARATA